MRGGSIAIAYYQPAVLVSNFDVADNNLKIELSQDNGSTFEVLPRSLYNITSYAQGSELGASDRRLLQLLCPIPETATGSNAWILRISADTGIMSSTSNDN